MRDTLDLNKLAKEARRQNLWARFVLIITLLCLIASVVGVAYGSNLSSQVYLLNGDKWRSIKDYVGDVCTFQTSANGDTWLLTSDPLAVSRWTGNTWEIHKHPDEKTTSNVCRMTVYGQTIWIVTDKGVSRFDGNQWTSYTEISPHTTVSIAASPLGVYTIDTNGNLSKFTDNQWSTSNVQEILPEIRSSRVEHRPSIMAASDGSLLLRWNGLWRFDGDFWQEINIGGTYLDRVPLLGTAHNKMWTQWSEGIIVSRFDGSDWKPYDSNKIGLSSEDEIYQVAEYGNDTLFATDKGLIRFDGQIWTPLQLPNNQSFSVGQMSVLSSGDIWIVSNNLENVLVIILVLLGVTFTVIIYFVSIIVNSSRNTKRLRTARSLLEPIVPPIPNSREPRNSSWMLIGIIILFFVAVILTFAGRADLVNITTPIILVLMVLWGVQRIVQASGKEQKLLSKATPIVLFVGWMVILWLGMGWIDSVNSSLVAPFFVTWMIVGFVPCAVSVIRYLRRYEGENSYKNVSEDAAKNNVYGSRKIALQYVKAAAALNAGHIEEAETLAREAVANSQYLNSTLLSGSLNALGLALTYQKHYAEAIPLIEIAIRINPSMRPMLTSLAESYLEADVEIERALEVIQFALKYGSDSWLVRLIGKGSQPVTIGVYAWILARLGSFKEADNQIQKALKRIPAKNKAGVAYLQYIKGQIEALKGNSTQAAEWYQRASQSDKGLYGQLAETALKNLAPTA